LTLAKDGVEKREALDERPPGFVGDLQARETVLLNAVDFGKV
jgi:hypothetical protein